MFLLCNMQIPFPVWVALFTGSIGLLIVIHVLQVKPETDDMDDDMTDDELAPTPPPPPPPPPPVLIDIVRIVTR